MSYKLTGPEESMGAAAFIDLPVGFYADSTRLGSEKLLHDVRDMERESLLLVKREFSTVDSSGLSGVFIEDKELEKGREQSVNEVKFGQMVLTSFFDYERPELVAAKPFRRPNDAVHELAVSAILNKITRYKHAFQPIGLWRNVRGLYHLLSRYEHDVITFDSVLWADRDQEPEAVTPQSSAKAVRMSLLGLGQLHALGFSHNDAQAKNLGIDSERVRFIDLQSCQVFPRTHKNAPPDPINTGQRVLKDIDTFLSSCFEVPDNLEVIVPVLLDEAECMAKSYHRGVYRQRKPGSQRFPVEAIPSEEDIVSRIKDSVELAIT